MSTPYELARCLVCGGADVAEIASQEQVREEVEALWAYHTRRLRPETPPLHPSSMRERCDHVDGGCTLL